MVRASKRKRKLWLYYTNVFLERQCDCTINSSVASCGSLIMGYYKSHQDLKEDKAAVPTWRLTTIVVTKSWLLLPEIKDKHCLFMCCFAAYLTDPAALSPWCLLSMQVNRKTHMHWSDPSQSGSPPHNTLWRWGWDEQSFVWPEYVEQQVLVLCFVFLQTTAWGSKLKSISDLSGSLFICLSIC